MLDLKKISELGFGDMLSFNAYVDKPQIRYVEDDILSAIKDIDIIEKYINHFVIRILITDINEDTDTEIGFIRGKIIHSEEEMEDCNFYEVCDAHSQELEEMAEVLIEKNWNLKNEIVNERDTICYISEFYLNKKFRNLGIGSFVLENLAELISYYSEQMITKIIVLPEPLVKGKDGLLKAMSENNPEKEKLKEDLIKFYSENVFKEIENSRYMIKNLK